MRISRDSIVWWVGIVGSVVVGLADLSAAGNLAHYGIPEGAAPYLRLGALVVGIVSGKLATSPLAGKRDA